MFDLLAAHATVTLAALPVPAAIPNPIDGLVPDFSVFGAKFDAAWKKIFIGLWGLLLIMAIYYLARGILGIAQNQNSNPHAMRDSRKEAVQGAIAVGGLAALGVIVTAILTVVS